MEKVNAKIAVGDCITKVLEISTAHIKEDTAKWLSQEDCLLVSYEKGEYGWIVLVPEEGETIPQDLQQIFEVARSNGCNWVMLDRDAFTIENLPVYDW